MALGCTALIPAFFLADTPDQECHRCAGVRLLQTHALQQLPALQHLFQHHRDKENVTDSGALFCRDQKCGVFRPSLAILPSLLLAFSSSPSHPHMTATFI